MNGQFDYSLKTSDFILAVDENGKNHLFLEKDDYLITLSLDANNNIDGVALLFTNEKTLSESLNIFCHMCSIFTGSNYSEQKAQIEGCHITESEIKFADSSMVTTIGKYKYSTICNEFSVTLFCDKI